MPAFALLLCAFAVALVVTAGRPRLRQPFPPPRAPVAGQVPPPAAAEGHLEAPDQRPDRGRRREDG